MNKLFLLNKKTKLVREMQQCEDRDRLIILDDEILNINRQLDELYVRESRFEGMINRAMADPDSWVCRITYRDVPGSWTTRTISPIKWDHDCVRALCLGREEVRTFIISSIEECELVPAHEVLMPDQVKELGKSV